MAELTGQLHLALEAQQRLGGDLHTLGRHGHQLDGGWPTQQGVARLVHDAHPAAPELAHQRVLTELLGLCDLGLGARVEPTAASDSDQRAGHGDVDGHQRAAQPLVERERFVRVDLDGDAEVVLGEPAPRSDHHGAAVVAVTVEVAAVAPRERRLRHFGEGLSTARQVGGVVCCRRGPQGRAARRSLRPSRSVSRPRLRSSGSNREGDTITPWRSNA